MNATLTACDKDSSAGYVKKDKSEFLEGYKEFEQAVPFLPPLVSGSDNADVESWLE